MSDLIDKTAETLRNPKAGWVNRRDAAELLGQIAGRALKVLHERRQEPDVDVRRSVDAALGHASAALAGVPPEGGEKQCSLEEMAKACEKPGQRTVEPAGAGYKVTLKLKDDRHQTVYLSPHERKDGENLIRIFTRCGKPTEDSLKWALEANMKLAHAALALSTENGEERLVLTRCLLASQATPAEVRSCVKEIAFYGDWLEQKLNGLDNF